MIKTTRNHDGETLLIDGDRRYLAKDLIALKKRSPESLRNMLRAMQSGEMTVSRGIELVDMWLAGNYRDDMLPPVREGLGEDEMPWDRIDRLEADRIRIQSELNAEHELLCHERNCTADLKQQRDKANAAAKGAEADLNMYANAWQRELCAYDGKIRNKRHHIDAMVLTTRDFVERLKNAEQQRDHERAHREHLVKILSGIHALLYPPITTDGNGKKWAFHSPIVHEQVQELSDRIRAIPDEIAAAAGAKVKP